MKRGTGIAVGLALALLAGVAAASRMLWPVIGPLTSGFRTPSRPTHNGIDIAVPVGTEIVAPFDGTVSDTYTHERGGRSMLIDMDNGMRAGFAHLSEWLATPGQRVRRGQVVALSGDTGVVTGPHLHFTLKRGDTYLDPTAHLS